jgi:TRAP-type C4-dicarboxylate transport system substrate-binding protein
MVAMAGIEEVISSMDQVKGLRIACNAQTAPIVSALGGAPVTVPISETYDAVQKAVGRRLPARCSGIAEF